jgi:predicted transcriptional regulator
MTTITVEIDKDQDVSAVEAALSKLGVRYHVDADDNDWGDLSEAEIEGIKAGLADSEAGRIHSHEYVMNYMNEKMQKLIAGKK